MLAPTIVYDLDGTLADTAEDLVATLNWLLAERRPCAIAGRKRRLAAWRRRAGADQARLRRFRQEPRAEAIEALFADYLQYYNAHIADRTRLYPGVDKALAAFARAGWRQAVCTNKIEVSAKLLITKLGIANRFAFVCGQDTFGVGKPDPKPLLETIAAAGGSRKYARSWSAIRKRTSRPRARPACLSSRSTSAMRTGPLKNSDLTG